MESKAVKCLLVDDEDDFRKLMGFWLRSKGYQVIEASEGESAVRFTKEEKPDIIFIDLIIPLVDGIEALRRIREFNKDIPVIIISACISDEKVEGALSYGISGFFYKGGDFNEALSLLESALESRKQ